MTITRVGGTATVATNAETCTIDGIVNPVSAGSTGTYTITTTDASDVPIDSDAAVTADMITSPANITIASAKITSSNTVLVTFVNPVQNLASVDYTKWYIDVNNTGVGSLTPISAVVTSAPSPWTVTLTFTGTPFLDTATVYDAAHGLYVDASGVTDTAGDTNVVVGHASSILISDGQKPIPVSATFYDTNNDGKLDTISVIWSEAPLTPVADGSADWAITSAADFADLTEGTVKCNSGGAAGNECVYNFTTSTVKTRVGDLTLTYTAGTSVTDGINTADSITFTSGSTPTFIDGAKPILVSFTSTTLDGTYGPGSNINITATYSENIASGSVTVDLNNHPTTLITLSTISTNKLSGNYVVGATGSGQDITGLDVLTITANSATDTVPLADTDTTIPTINITTASNINVDTTAPSTPIASPIADTYTSVQGVTLSSVGSTSIRYTVDDTDPSTCSSGLLYSGAIAVSSSLTIKARGCDDVDNISLLGTFIYTINIPVVAGSGGGRLFPVVECKIGELFSVITGKSCATNDTSNATVVVSLSPPPTITPPVVFPKLPKTGFPPRETGGIPWNIVIFSIFVVVPIAFAVILKKRTISPLNKD